MWGDASDDLNATLLEWSAGAGPPEHVNDERDVLVFVVDGSAKLVVDGEESELVPAMLSSSPRANSGGSRPGGAVFATCPSTSSGRRSRFAQRAAIRIDRARRMPAAPGS